MFLIDHYGIIHQYDVKFCKKESENYSLAIDPRKFPFDLFQKSFGSYIYHPVKNILVQPWKSQSYFPCSFPSYIDGRVECSENYFIKIKDFQIIRQNVNNYFIKFNNHKDKVVKIEIGSQFVLIQGKKSNYLVLLSPIQVIPFHKKLTDMRFVFVDSTYIYFFNINESSLLQFNIKNGKLKYVKKLVIHPTDLSFSHEQINNVIKKDSILLFSYQKHIVLYRYIIDDSIMKLEKLCSIKLEENLLNKLFYYFDSKGKDISEKLELSLLYGLTDTTLYLLRLAYDQYAIHPYVIFEFDTTFLKEILGHPSFWSDILYFRYDPYSLLKSTYLNKIKSRIYNIYKNLTNIKDNLDDCTFLEASLILSFYMRDTVQAEKSIQGLELYGCLNVYHLIWYTLTKNIAKFYSIYPYIKDSLPISNFIYSLFCSDAYQAYKTIQTYLSKEKDPVFQAYALYWRSFVLIKLRDLIAAKRAIENAMEIKENVPQFWELLADIAYLEEDYQKAISLYTILIDRFGEEPIWYQKRGVSWINYGEPEKGCSDLWYASERGDEISSTLFNELCKK